MHALDGPAFGPRELLEDTALYLEDVVNLLFVDFQQTLFNEHPVAIEVTKAQVILIIILHCNLDIEWDQRPVKRPQMQNLGIGNHAVKIEYHCFQHKFYWFPIPSSFVIHSLKCRHSRRIVSSPILRAITIPSKVFT